jgi:hypothetical protein
LDTKYSASPATVDVPLAHCQNGTPNAHCQSLANGELRCLARLMHIDQKLNPPLGPEHAGAGQPAYDRVARQDWINPYTRPVRLVSLSPILEHQQRIMQRVLGR